MTAAAYLHMHPKELLLFCTLAPSLGVNVIIMDMTSRTMKILMHRRIAALNFVDKSRAMGASLINT